MTLKFAKTLCKIFGDPNVKLKQCVECFHEEEDLWMKCMNYKNKKVKGKTL